MKLAGSDFIINGRFVDDMMNIPTKEFIEKYFNNFDIMEGNLMETFLGIQVKQLDGTICLHLDKYIQDIVTEYSNFSAKPVRLKRVSTTNFLASLER
jgi:hypothetical protein